MADQETTPKACITNINYDCLERIFDCLDILDLLNVAGTCKCLQIAAAAKFSDEHGKKHVIMRFDDFDNLRLRQNFNMRPYNIRPPPNNVPPINMPPNNVSLNNMAPLINMPPINVPPLNIPPINVPPININLGDGISVLRDVIAVTGLKLQLPFLRHFGAKISHLVFESGCENAHKIVFNQYINKYCADTLTGFTICGRKEFTIQRPFKNLENLVIENGDLNEMFRQYVNWYPNLRYLEMHSVNVRVPGIRPLENLEKLIIKNTDLADKFPCFVDWYPNLRHLEMHNVIADTDHMAVSFPILEHLGISMCRSTMERVVILLRKNLQLRSLEIWMADSLFDPSLTMVLNMIRNHELILKLKVTVNDVNQVSAADLLQLSSEHPLVIELSLLKYQFTAQNALAFIRQLKALKKFEFCVQDVSQCNRIQDQLNDEWQFEHRLVEHDDFNAGNPVYAIVLNRNR